MQRRFRDKFRILGSTPLIPGCADSQAVSGPGHRAKTDAVPLPAKQAQNGKACMVPGSGEAGEREGLDIAEPSALRFQVEVTPTDPDWALPALGLEGKVLGTYPAAGTLSVTVEPGSCGLSASTRHMIDRILANQVVKLGNQADTLRSLLRFIESHASHVLNAAEDILVGRPQAPVPAPPDAPRTALRDLTGLVSAGASGAQPQAHDPSDRDLPPPGSQGSHSRTPDKRGHPLGGPAGNMGEDRREFEQGGASQVPAGPRDGSVRVGQALTHEIDWRMGELSLEQASLLDKAGWDAVGEDRQPWQAASADTGESDGGWTPDDDDSLGTWEGRSTSSGGGWDRSGSEAEDGQIGERDGRTVQNEAGLSLKRAADQKGVPQRASLGGAWLALRAQGLQLDQVDAVQPVRLSVQVCSLY